MAIRILATGGTFDKEYNERTGQLYFKDTHIAEMLRLGRSQVEVSIRTVMMTDSLEMTDADRNLIVQNCLQSRRESHRDYARHRHNDGNRGRGRWRCHRENSRANRSDDPLRLWQFRRPLQSGQRALVRAGTASRSLHCHTRSMLSLGPRPEKPRARRVRGNSAGLSAKSQVHLNRERGSPLGFALLSLARCGQLRTLLAGKTGKFFPEWVKRCAGLQRVTHEVCQIAEARCRKAT